MILNCRIFCSEGLLAMSEVIFDCYNLGGGATGVFLAIILLNTL